MRLPKWLQHVGQWFFAPVRLLWLWLDAIWTVVHPSRFSAAMIVLAAALLLLTDQGPELSVQLAEGGMRTWIAFALAALYWSLQSWLWSRAGLSAEFTGDRTKWRKPKPGRLGHSGLNLGWLIEYLPRLYGLLVYGVAALSLWTSGVDGGGAGVLGVLAIATFAFLMLRLRIARALGIESEIGQQNMPAGPGGISARRRAQALLRRSEFWLWGSLVPMVAIGAVMVAIPSEAGRWLGAPAVAFLAFGCIVPAGSAAVMILRGFGVPAVIALAAWALVGGIWVDGHAVRSLAGSGDPSESRPTVAAAAETWWSANKDLAQDGEPVPILFVSAAGGGLRAAQWTATVLGTLQQRDPCFLSRVFSISGVSGGSLGAVVFHKTAVGRAELERQACADGGAGDSGILEHGRAVLQQDFLAPVVAGWLFPDLMDNFLFLLPAFPKDRAGALEVAWESAWVEACAQRPDDPVCAGGGLDGAFLAAWPACGADGEGCGETGRPWHPALLLNGTHQETGKRVITSNLAILQKDFLDAFDFYALTRNEIRVSTAALNSARFPFVTPAGALIDARTEEARGHVLDGGYFENYGAATTREVAAAALRHLQGKGANVQPVFIEILSDPGLSDDDRYRDGMSGRSREVCRRFVAGAMAEPCAAAASCELEFLRLDGDSAGHADLRSFGNELLAPLDAMFSTRESRGILAAKELVRLAGVLSAAGGVPSFPPPDDAASGGAASGNVAPGDAGPGDATPGDATAAHIDDPVFFQFALPPRGLERNPPLGWVLSKRNADAIGDLLAGEGACLEVLLPKP